MMTWRMGAVVAVLGVVAPGCAQTHKVEKPQVVVRAVGVYEWTGDLAKPDASRLIPVSLFIDNTLQDAGVYLARPVPFALGTGTVFELDQAGIAKGTVDLSFARHLEPGADAKTDTPYDDGWFGYGVYKPLPALKVKPGTRVRQSNAQVAVNGKVNADRPTFAKKPNASTTTAPSDPDRPTMKRKDDAGSGSTSTSSGTTSATTPPDDPDRPTMKRKDDSSSTSTAPAGSTTPAPTTTTASSGSATSMPKDDPDRPTLTRKNGTTASSDDASTPASSSTAASSGSGSSTDEADRPTMRRKSDSDSGSAGSVPDNDPDRPTLKKRSPAEAKQAQKERNSSGVESTGSLNDDPNRPKMHRGKPAGALGDDDLPKLLGLPKDLHQMVAVSDAVDRPVHNFTRPWDDDQEKQVILGKMQAFARTQIEAYAATLPKPAAAPAKPAPTTAAARRRAAAKAAQPPVIGLQDEELKAYELSYGGAATYVYTASSAPEGAGQAVRYVSLVAQADALGELKVAMSSVTDAQHLDRTPRMRLVDAVDVEASNRASLLMELRAQHTRQFALYRVIGAQSQQIFTTGSTQ